MPPEFPQNGRADIEIAQAREAAVAKLATKELPLQGYLGFLPGETALLYGRHGRLGLGYMHVTWNGVDSNQAVLQWNRDEDLFIDGMRKKSGTRLTHQYSSDENPKGKSGSLVLKFPVVTAADIYLGENLHLSTSEALTDDGREFLLVEVRSTEKPDVIRGKNMPGENPRLAFEGVTAEWRARTPAEPLPIG